MPADAPTIVATSGGMRAGRRSRLAFAPLVEHAVELSGTTGRPKLVHLGTASGRPALVERRARRGRRGRRLGTCATSTSSACPASTTRRRCSSRPTSSGWAAARVVNLLAVWRAHGLDEVFRRVWQAGVVLGGVSAGSICWHVGRHHRLLRARPCGR
ncbi:MAG: Type 1 glutamine amidotransferase-like domain-containing protein [Quadrisphaera sp.]